MSSPLTLKDLILQLKIAQGREDHIAFDNTLSVATNLVLDQASEAAGVRQPFDPLATSGSLSANVQFTSVLYSALEQSSLIGNKAIGEALAGSLVRGIIASGGGWAVGSLAYTILKSTPTSFSDVIAPDRMFMAAVGDAEAAGLIPQGGFTVNNPDGTVTRYGMSLGATSSYFSVDVINPSTNAILGHESQVVNLWNSSASDDFSVKLTPGSTGILTINGQRILLTDMGGVINSLADGSIVVQGLGGQYYQLQGFTDAHGSGISIGDQSGKIISSFYNSDISRINLGQNQSSSLGLFFSSVDRQLYINSATGESALYQQDVQTASWSNVQFVGVNPSDAGDGVFTLHIGTQDLISAIFDRVIYNNVPVSPDGKVQAALGGIGLGPAYLNGYSSQIPSSSAASQLETEVNVSVGLDTPSGSITNSQLLVSVNQLTQVIGTNSGSGGDGTPLPGSNVIFASGGVTISDVSQADTDLASLSSSSIANAFWRPYYQTTLSGLNDVPAAMDIFNSSAGVTSFPTEPLLQIQNLAPSAILTNPAPSFTDPLLLDLTGAGIAVSNWIKSPVYFDTNVKPDANGNPTTTPDGMQHETAWMKLGTAMLVFEAGGVVRPITDITQTVSEFLNAGPTPGQYADGLAALASLVKTDPTTGKPYTVFSAQTAAIDPATGVSYWNEIMVWNDTNQNAVNEAGEVVTLDSLGISSISLVGSGNWGETLNGNVVTNRGTFTRIDGTVGQTAAVNFQNDSIGNVATTANGGTVIQSISEGGPTLATTFVAQNSIAHTYAIQNGKLTDQTTGAVIANSGITAVLSSTQADHITVAATDTGTYWLGGGTGADVLTGGGGTNVFLVNPNTVVHGGTGANSFNIAKVTGTSAITINLLASHLQEVIGGAGGGTFNASGTTWNVFIQATSGNNILIGGAATAALSGGTGDDFMELGAGGGVVHAGLGNDVIFGGSGLTAQTQPNYVNAGTSSNAAYIERLFNGGLGREADLNSYQNYKAQLDNGSLTHAAMATTIVGSAEWQTRYGTQTNTQFVNSIFQNLLGRAPTASELNNFVSALNGGQTRGVALQTVADSAESQARWGSLHPGASDVIYAGPGNDIVTLGTNNSEVFVGSGNLTVIGNANGFSVLGLHGSYADYTLTHNADGTVTVTNIDNMDGDGTVTMKNVTALDFKDISQIPVASTTGMPINDRLNAGNTAQVTTNASGQYVISTATLLQNDINYSGASLSIQSILDNSSVAHGVGSAATVNGGTATLNPNGTVTFTPTQGYAGLMSFRYNLVNGTVVQQVGTTNTAAMTATVYLNTPSQPIDPQFDAEWFLQAANVIPVWADYTGAGVSIGIFDPSGNVDFSNPDLAANSGQSIKLDGTPGIQTIGTHATLVAGVIGAARNGLGAVGVAYNATISSEAMPTNTSGDLRIEDWVKYDVVNNSWGFDTPFTDSFFVNPDYLSAYENAAINGRNGLGTIMVFASGNQRALRRNTNDSNETNNDFGITVGGINASTDLGSLVVSGAPFSTPGVSILVSAPANNITSTGVNFTNQFGQQFGADYQTAQGTSFATPIVSGIVALMLEANPDLGYRDVQQILAETSIKVNDTNTVWQTNGANLWNGGGLHYSADYGYGEVDARAAVRLAETWIKQQTFANQLTSNWLQSSAPVSLLTGYQYSSGGVNINSGDNTTLVIGSTSTTISHGYTNVRYVGSRDLTLEDVEVSIDLDITALPLANAKIILAPYHLSEDNIFGQIIDKYTEGTESVLLNNEGVAPDSSAIVIGSDGHQHLQFQLNSVAYMGVQAASTDIWVVRVVDTRTGQDVDTAVNWQLQFLGSPTTDPKQWIFTDEYAGGATINPVTTSDSFNASAATGNNIIDLRSGSTDSRVDGRAVSVGSSGTLIYGFGGDGNDTIYANNAGDVLDGGRGTNVLNGGTGKDTFDLEFGSNTVNGGGGQDVADYFLAKSGITANLATGLVSKAGGLTDQLNGVQSVVGSNFDDILTLGSGSNFVAGEGGNDLLYGRTDSGTAQMVLEGGTGDDTYVISNLHDFVSENAGEGTDTVRTTLASYTLQANVENLVGTAATGQTLTGNSLDNTISASAGSTLVGGGGNDRLIGSAGIDTAVYSGNAADYVINTTSAGITTITDKIAGRDGTDTLTAIEYLRFADRTDASPLAHDDTGADNLDRIATLTAAGLLANDTDIDSGDTKTLVSVSATSALGAAVSIQNGNVVYDPRAAAALHLIGAGQSESDTFTYTMKDAAGATSTATVTMTVNGVAAPATPAGVFRVGPEFLVNTQTQSYQSQPNVGKLANGGFVITWTDAYDPTGGYNNSIKAQIYSSSGDKVGSELLVNSYIGSQDTSGVTGLSNGGFVVTWHDYSGALGGSTNGSIKAQVYTASGIKVGAEFLVSAVTGGSQAWPVVVSLTGGGFVVAFEDNSGTFGTSAHSVVAQRFDASGSKVGNEFLIDTPTSDWQGQVQLAGLPGGGFVATWEDEDGSGIGGYSVKARIFDSSGNKVGNEFKVNTTDTAGLYVKPMITALSGGGFVMTWWGLTSAEAQLFDAAGNKVGSEFAAGPTNFTSSSSEPLTVTSLANGGFSVAWTDYSGIGGDISAPGVAVQIFDLNGHKVGTPFLVNTQTAGAQWRPSMTSLANGNLAITWVDASGTLGDSSGTSIKAQVFGIDALTPTFSRAMASAPTLRVQTTAGNAGSSISLSIASALAVTSGQESLSIKVSGLPSGATLSAGSQNADGSWTLTPLQLMNLKLMAGPASAFIGVAHLAVTSTEAAMNGSSASSASSASVIIAGTVSTYDTQNRMTLTTTVDLYGTKSVTNYDVTNSQPWVSQIHSYDSTGNLVSITSNNDDGTQTGSRPDGTHWSTVFDTANKYSWASFRIDYDAASKMTSQTVVNDNQIKVVNAYNPSNGAWTSTTVYDAAGHTVSQAGTKSDGSHWLTAYDVNTQYSWANFTNTYSGITDPAHPETNWTFLTQTGVNHDGTTNIDPSQTAAAMDTLIWYSSPYLPIPNLTPQTGANPDGSTWSILTDTVDAYSWNTIRKDYTASGVLSKLTGTTDGGSSWINIYDTTGTGAHIWEVSVYDANGKPVTWSGTNRSDGSHWVTAYDVNNQYAWSTFTNTYDSQWNLLTQTEHNHDGTTTVNASAIAAALDVLPWYASPYDPTPTSPPAGGGDDKLPVILDLTGNGINLSLLGESNAAFDVTGNGQRVHTAWAGSGNGILAIDLAAGGALGPDGVIDQSKEIVFSEWDPGATSDMQALRDVFDTDHNGKLDPGDARWSDFRIWQDANGDGISNTGEVKTLDQLGITSIDLNPTGPAQRFADGSVIQGLSTYNRADGTTGVAADVGLAYATNVGSDAGDAYRLGQVDSLVQAMTAFEANHATSYAASAANSAVGGPATENPATLAPTISTWHQAA